FHVLRIRSNRPGISLNHPTSTPPTTLSLHDALPISSQHPRATEIGERLTTACIDCHMPNRRSKAIEINTPTKQFALYFRSHAIGIYPEVARAVLRSNGAARSR